MNLFRVPSLVQISLAHFVSHVHIMAVPAVLPFLPEAMDVSYTDLGIALVIFNVISAFVQPPIGYAVDRYGGRVMLILALALGAASYLMLALYPSYEILLAAMCLAGFANGIYHPADYALLSRLTGKAKIGRAFSYHTFSGFVGTAVTPGWMVALILAVGIQWAFVSVAAAAFAVLVVVFTNQMPTAQKSTDTKAGVHKTRQRPPLRERLQPIAVLFVLFIFLSLASSAIDKFAITAFVAAQNISLAVATLSITLFLFLSAAGVLIGGRIADRTKHHGAFGACCFLISALLIAYVVAMRPPDSVMVTLFGIAGLAGGLVAPSRDMLVRSIAPAGAEGRIFGFVTTGFNIGSLIGPICFGMMLDHGFGVGVLWSGVAAMLFAGVIMLFQEFGSHKS